MDHSKETGFQPIRKSTMGGILLFQEATKKKSLQILENNVAEGADGFKLRFFPNHIRTSKRKRRASVQRQRC